MELKYIEGKKNKAADILSRNKFVYKPNEKVDTQEFEEKIHEMHVNEMTVPVDYETICLHQRDDLELQSYRTHETTRGNYKTEQFGKSILWTKKGTDG